MNLKKNILSFRCGIRKLELYLEDNKVRLSFPLVQRKYSTLTIQAAESAKKKDPKTTAARPHEKRIRFLDFISNKSISLK